MGVFSWGLFHPKANKQLAEAVVALKKLPLEHNPEPFEKSILSALKNGAKPSRLIEWDRTGGHIQKDTALDIMVTLGNVKICKALLDHGAMITHKQRTPRMKLGASTLHPCTMSDWSRAAEDHIQAGTDIDKEQDFFLLGQMLLEHSSFSSFKETGVEWADDCLMTLSVMPLEKAEKFVTILVNQGADINRLGVDHLGKNAVGALQSERWEILRRTINERKECGQLKELLQHEVGIGEKPVVRRKM